MAVPFEPLVRDLMAMLVQGKYGALESLTGGERLSAAELEAAVSGYPATFIIPPRDFAPSLEVTAHDGAPPASWSVRVPLWSREEGRSGLTLRLVVRERPEGGFQVVIEDVTAS